MFDDGDEQIIRSNHFQALNTLDDPESSDKEHNEAFDKRDHSEYHLGVDTNTDY